MVANFLCMKLQKSGFRFNTRLDLTCFFCSFARFSRSLRQRVKQVCRITYISFDTIRSILIPEYFWVIDQGRVQYKIFELLTSE